jgi:hypothetical protein
LIPGQKYVTSQPLVNSEKVFQPTLYIKLELMRNFVNAMDLNESEFLYLEYNNSEDQWTKVKEGIFNGPQIIEVTIDSEFDGIVSEVESAVWKVFQAVSTDFSGNFKAEN